MTNQESCLRPLVPAALTVAALSLGYVLLSPSEANAACAQSENNVDCTGVDGDGFISAQSLNVRIDPYALVGNIVSRNVTGRCPLSLPAISVGAASNVFNEGTISTFGVCGFGIVAENGSTVINTGAILTHDLIAYGILTGDNVTVRTSGRISTDYQGSGGIFGGAGMRVTVETGGTINTNGIGANGIEVGTNSFVINDGAIVARADASVGVSGAAGTMLINNGNVETSANNSVGVQIVNGSLTNTGRIRSSLSGPALALTPTIGVSVIGKEAYFTNAASGIVEATHIGVRLEESRTAAVANAGRIEASPASNIDGTLRLNGAAIFVAGPSPAEIANTGIITGRDGLPALQSMGAQVTLDNGGTITGDVLLAGGNDVVTYRAGSIINGVVDFGTGDDLIIFQGDGTFAAPVLNAEILTKSGSGSLVLARDLMIRDQVNIFAGGGLVINPGVRLTSVATGNTGLLRGAGTINGLVTNSGTIAPGTQNAKGALTISGAFQQFANGTLAIRISPDGSSDRLVVGGTANLAGTLALIYEGTAFRDGQRFDVMAPLSGSLSRTGQFTLAAPELAFVKAELVTGASGGVAVEIDRLSYSVAGVTPSQQSVGRLFDRLQASPPAALSTTLERLEFSTPDAATTLLADFTAEAPGGVQNLGLLTLERLAQGLERRAPVKDSRGHIAWAHGFSSASRSRGAASAADFDVHGLIAGLDMAFGQTWFGIAAARANGDFGRGTTTATLDASLLALTAGTTLGDIGVVASIAYGRGSPEMRRMLSGAPHEIASEAHSDLWTVSLEGSYEKALGPVILSPHAGAAYHRVGLSAIDEGRTLAVLTTPDALNALRARLGAGLSAAIGRVRPYGDVSLSVEFLQRMPRISASLIGVPNGGFELYGDARRRFAVDAEAGLAVTITPGLEGYVAGRMTANDLLAGRTLSAGLTYRW